VPLLDIKNPPRVRPVAAKADNHCSEEMNYFSNEKFERFKTRRKFVPRIRVQVW
jgi:hypothetical protein